MPILNTKERNGCCNDRNKEGYKMSAINHKTGACSMRVVSKEKVFNKLLELVDFDFIKSIIW